MSLLSNIGDLQKYEIHLHDDTVWQAVAMVQGFSTFGWGRDYFYIDLCLNLNIYTTKIIQHYFVFNNFYTFLNLKHVYTFYNRN